MSSETGESVTQNGGTNSRLTLWSSFLVFATIVMISAIQVKDNEDEASSASKYIVAISIVTFLFNVIIVGAHFHPIGTVIFIGTKIEGTIVIVLVVLWSAIVAVNTQAGLALSPGADGSDSIRDANLYYFSWAGFITSIVLFVSFLRDAFGVNVVAAVRGVGDKRLEWWAGLVAVSIIVLGAAAEALKNDCNKGDDFVFPDGYCPRTKWAISASTLNIVLCLLVIFTKIVKYSSSEGFAPFIVEAGSALLLTIMNIFVVFFTTSVKGPGRMVGNLYYFSWAMCLISVFILSKCYSDYVTFTSQQSSSSSSSTHNNEEEIDVRNRTMRNQQLDVEFDDNL